MCFSLISYLSALETVNPPMARTLLTSLLACFCCCLPIFCVGGDVIFLTQTPPGPWWGWGTSRRFLAPWYVLGWSTFGMFWWKTLFLGTVTWGDRTGMLGVDGGETDWHWPGVWGTEKDGLGILLETPLIWFCSGVLCICGVKDIGSYCGGYGWLVVWSWWSWVAICGWKVGWVVGG